jgi:hypothetical protein
VHCLEYISEYLAAHADNELTPSQLRDADEHVSRCAACRMRLAREHVLKQMIRQNTRPLRTPAALRLKVRAALNDNASASAANIAIGRRPARHYGGDKSDRVPSLRVASRRLRQSRAWIPLGLTGSLMILLALLAGHSMRHAVAAADASVPAFDVAIGKYLQFQQAFVSNVPPEAYHSQDGVVYAWVEERDPVHRVVDDDSPDSADISRSYHEVNMPDDLLDFSAAGYRIAGARVDHLPNGGLVTYTMYQGEAGAILSLCFSDPTMAAPVGAAEWLGMRSFYTYKGYSICLSFYPTGHFVSILVTRMPMRQLLREVAGTDTMVVSQRWQRPG